MRRLFLALAMGVSAIAATAALEAGSLDPAPQTQSSKLLITVSDPSGGVIPGATVTVTPQDAPAKAGAPAIPPVLTTAAGVATIDGLAPGRYIITAEFSGFETVILKDYRIRPGENKRGVVLPCLLYTSDAADE